MEEYSFIYNLKDKIFETLVCYQDFYEKIGLQKFVDDYQKEKQKVDSNYSVEKLIDLKINRADNELIKNIMLDTYTNYDVVWHNGRPDVYLKSKNKRKLTEPFKKAVEKECLWYAPHDSNLTKSGEVILYIFTQEEIDKMKDEQIIAEGTAINKELPSTLEIAKQQSIKQEVKTDGDQ